MTRSILMDFVDVLTKRNADTVEKVLLHILDTSRKRWNEKASDILHQLRDSSGLDADTVQSLRRDYREAFNNAHRISQMRYGIAKRTK